MNKIDKYGIQLQNALTEIENMDENEYIEVSLTLKYFYDLAKQFKTQDFQNKNQYENFIKYLAENRLIIEEKIEKLKVGEPDLIRSGFLFSRMVFEPLINIPINYRTADLLV
jgi:hypothetical protein